MTTTYTCKCLNCYKEFDSDYADVEFCTEKCAENYFHRASRAGSEKKLKEEKDWNKRLLKAMKGGTCRS